MCTLTFRLFEQGYQVFFNRDESRLRKQAIPPTVHQHLNHQAIYPIDPVGGGTWIAVNKKGKTLALLNYYQAQINSDKAFISRGTIIPQLLDSEQDINLQLENMDLSRFQAFQLCVFEVGLTAISSDTELAQTYIWDGKELTHRSLLTSDALPITSSALDFEQVYAYRKQTFEQLVSSPLAPENNFQLFHQHQNHDGKLSVLMSRADAHTVSFAQILVQQSVKQKQITFSYRDYLSSDIQERQLHL